ncbi:MAG TPA: type III PLP-dependent enzyme [Steroidobacteraceae bacterium]|nr:type III PLP-dependent enzyme [Steroidobacteraceae bacterium]
MDSGQWPARPGADAPLFDPALDPHGEEAIRRLTTLYGSPLLIVDAERLRARYRRLAAALPGVDLHVALKPLPHRSVVEVLRDEGASFDLATNGEVELARRARVPADRCIHTHPIKRDGDIRSALAAGLDTFVVDNPDEIRKFVHLRKQVRLLIRVAFRHPGALCDLSRKFGCDPADVEDLIGLAHSFDLRVRGLSFHVGSQASDSMMHVEAVAACAALFERAAARGVRLEILDIGGGFPADYREPALPIERFCAPIRTALAALPREVRVIAEPGRYIVAPAAVGVATVMGRARRGDRWWYYLDDGLYGSYSGRLYDHASYQIDALTHGAERLPSVLAGPTCDGIDVIEENVALPRLAIGDLVIGRSMGAYTWASASEFNFFPKATVLVVDRGGLFGGRDSP